MIQIHAIRDRRDYKTGKITHNGQCIDKKIRVPMVEDLFNTPLDFIEKLPDSERYNLYYTIGECHEDKDGRELDTQHHVPIDIDGMDLPEGKEVDFEMLEMAARAACDSIEIDYNKTGVLFTGNGLQLIIGIKEPITDKKFFDTARGAYKAICQRIDLALMANNIIGKCDVSVWSAARLMRYPETVNKKPSKPTRTGKILQGNIERLDFDLVKVSGIPVLENKDSLNKDAYRLYSEPDIKEILDTDRGCKFLSWMKAKPDDVSEPQWYAGLSILGLLGRDVAHDYSKGHPDYTYEGCEAKIDQALDASGPRTCHSINNLSDTCKSCVHYKKDIKSPILIKSDEFIKTKNTGFYKITVDKDGNPKIGKPDYLGLVQHFVNEIGIYKTLPGTSYVYVFNGKYFEVMEKDECLEFAYKYLSPKPESRLTEEFFKQLRMREGCLVRPDWLGQSIMDKVCFDNGVFDTKKMELIPHSPDFGFQSALTCKYDKDAVSPNFDKFLKQITRDDQEIEDLLMQFFGYSMIGSDCTHQKGLLMSGGGSNGKSTLLDTLKDLLGLGGYSSVSIKNMSNEQTRFLMMGKKVNIAEENSRDSFRDVETVKNFITGGNIQVKKVYSAPFEYRNTTKLILSCNEMPDTGDLSHGFFRRFIIIPFRAVFSIEKGNMDKKIGEKLKAELPGIFNRFLQGWYSLEKKGDFSNSKESDKALDVFKEDSKPHVQWYQEQVIYDIDNEEGTSRDELYTHYSDWCLRNGIARQKIQSSRKFFREGLGAHLGSRFIEHRPGTTQRKRKVRYLQIDTDY